jgi:hypothetical protein
LQGLATTLCGHLGGNGRVNSHHVTVRDEIHSYKGRGQAMGDPVDDTDAAPYCT